MGTLKTEPARTRPDLLATPVLASLETWPGATTVDDILVAPIDPTLADTAAFCEAYDVRLDVSANCVVVAGKREGAVRYAACMVLATTRADVNNVVRRYLDVRKASFAPMAEAVTLTGMEYGGITPIGLPPDWPVLVDSRVAYGPARSRFPAPPWPSCPALRSSRAWPNRSNDRPSAIPLHVKQVGVSSALCCPPTSPKADPARGPGA
jgi:prolyl-tRNA editing enzyme YbaK/EbsC (Cys-tRNA(Pro) deacylase)